MMENDIRITIIAVLGMLLTFAVIFNIYQYIENRKSWKAEALSKLEAAEWKNKYEEEIKKNKPREIINKVEKFVVEPVVLKSKTSFSNYISMSEELKKRTIYEDLARGLVDQFIENPNLVCTQEEVNPMYDSTIYQTVIRIVPFKED